MTMSFLNKIVLITGASSGIGEAIAFQFAKLSARLYLIDKDSENLKKTAEHCEKLSRAKVIIGIGDLRNDAVVEKVVKDAMKEFGRIDVVINCAGVYNNGRILDPDMIQVFDDVLAINLRSIVKMTNCVASALIESQGCIVNISSVISVVTLDDSISYNISKAALVHFSKCVALELAPKGVRVNCILPGPVSTNILMNLGISREQSDALWNLSAKSVPLKHLPKTEEVAELAVYLASDKAKSMTGASYLIDSGFSLKGPSDQTMARK